MDSLKSKLDAKKKELEPLRHDCRLKEAAMNKAIKAFNKCKNKKDEIEQEIVELQKEIEATQKPASATAVLSQMNQGMGQSSHQTNFNISQQPAEPEQALKEEMEAKWKILAKDMELELESD